jgi:transcriptional regulator GlxA family with amidase domain
MFPKLLRRQKPDQGNRMKEMLRIEETFGKLRDTSVRQLERLFVAETGKSPNVYGRQLRVRMAAWMLTGSDRTVSDIAMSCGFSDASHLGREFRKEFGESPSVYRTTRSHAHQAAACGG